MEDKCSIISLAFNSVIHWQSARRPCNNKKKSKRKIYSSREVKPIPTDKQTLVGCAHIFKYREVQLSIK